MKPHLLILLASAASAAAWPAVGPNFVRPAVTLPETYQDTSYAGAIPWREGRSGVASGDEAWWSAFGDPVLDDLVRRALAANHDLQAGAARVLQARALAGATRGGLLPQVSVNGSVARDRASETTANVLPETLTTTYRAPATMFWELDLFGRVRRQLEGSRAEWASSEAAFQALRLALAAEVSGHYFSLRAIERELALLERTVALRTRALELVEARHQHGTAGEADVARAQTERAIAEAEAVALRQRRSVAENALAVLLGEPPGRLRLPEPATDPVVPAVPAGLPSELLERRPDVAAAEHALAAANARIGVAKAAFFPAISLTGSAGFASADIDRLFSADSRAWSIGPAVYLPIFQGGRNRANLERSKAAFEEAVAGFRQRVLVAFREVQDALTGTHLLAEQVGAQQRALVAARRAAELAQVRYDAGFVSYLEVIDAERTALAIERTASQLDAQRLQTAVALIKALGGGWRESRAQVIAASGEAP